MYEFLKYYFIDWFPQMMLAIGIFIILFGAFIIWGNKK